MRVGRQAAADAAGHFAAEVVELVLAQAPFEEGARIHARRGVRLEVDEVAGVRLAARTEEVVEAHLEEVGDRRVGRDVAAELGVGLVRARHHR